MGEERLHPPGLDKDKGAAKTAALLVAQMARLFAKALGEAIAPLGLAPAQYMVLRELWKADGATQSDLSRRLELEQATMANTLKRMKRDGLILTAPHPTDNRARMVHLTDKARDLEGPAKAAAKEVNALALADLGRKDRKRFLDLSKRVVASLKAEGVDRAVAAPRLDPDVPADPDEPAN